jgi:hypothetical protein
VLIWLLAPLVFAFALTRFDVARLFYRRYLMFSYPALLILTAGLGTICRSRRERIVYALLVVAAVNVLLGPWRQFASDGRFVRHSPEGWREAVSELNADLSNATLPTAAIGPVLVRAGLVEENLIQTSADIAALGDYLLFPVSSIYRLDARYHAQVLTTSLLVTESTRRDLRSADCCWLLIRGTKWFELHSTTLIERLRGWIGRDRKLVLDKRRDFGNVVLIRCQIAAPTP